MSLRHTDVLIVGGELAGAVAAAVCARAGRRVVVLEEGEADDAIHVGGVVAPPLDDLWPLLDALPRGMAPLEALGQKQDLRRTLPTSVRGLQFLHPEHRMDVPSEQDHRVRECLRELGQEGARVAELLAAVDADVHAAWARMDGLDALADTGFFASRKAHAAARAALSASATPVPGRVGDSATWLSSMLDGAMAWLAHGGDVPAVVKQRILEAALKGIHVAPGGGRNALRQQLLEAARQRGAEVMKAERAAAFVVDGGRVDEVRLDGRHDGLAGKAVIDATRARDLLTRLSPEKHGKKYGALQDRARVVGTRVGMTWAVRREGLPAGMAERAVLAAEGDEPGRGSALLCLTREPGSVDVKKPVKGVGTLSIAVVAPLGAEAAAVDAARARLRTLFPFMEAHRVEERVVGVEAAEAARHAVYAATEDAGLLNGRGVETSLKGVFRAGRDVAPALGIEGELWAGHAAGTWADRWASRKPWFGGAAESAGT